MVDFILFTFWIGTFACGFWCGKKFGSLTEMASACKAKFRSWL